MITGPGRSQQLPPPTLGGQPRGGTGTFSGHLSRLTSSALHPGGAGEGVGSGVPRARPAVRSWRGSRWALTRLLTEPGRTYCVCSRGGLSSDWKDHPPRPCPPRPPHLSSPYGGQNWGPCGVPAQGSSQPLGGREEKGKRPRARAPTVLICSVRVTITRFKDLATCMIALVLSTILWGVISLSQMRKLSFREHRLPKVRGQARLWGGVGGSALLSSRRLFGSSAADGGTGTKLGQG